MPYAPYLVFGTVTNSLSNVESSASVKITTSLGTLNGITNSSGLFVFDLASVGYSSGETVTIATQNKFNNEYSSDTFVVSGGMYNSNISLSVRESAQGVVGYTNKSMIHNIGNNPISIENPFPVKTMNNSMDNYANAGVDNSGYAGYMDKEGNWFIQYQNQSDFTFKYARGTSGFSTNWTNRTSLTYSWFSEVF